MERFRRRARKLDQLIYDIAEYKRPRDREALYVELRSVALYAPIAATNVDVPSGTRVTVGPTDVMQLGNARLPNGLTVLPFFISKDDPRLGLRFAEFSPREAFEMVTQVDDLDGLLIQNSKDSWVAIPKEEIHRLLGEDVL